MSNVIDIEKYRKLKERKEQENDMNIMIAELSDDIDSILDSLGCFYNSKEEYIDQLWKIRDYLIKIIEPKFPEN